jgi:hypothetical protein
MRTWRMIAAFGGLGILGMSAFGAETARPGTVNYVEGVAILNGKALNDKQVGSESMNAGDEIRTGDGKAEILLTPGIYLRVDSNSAVKMVTPDLAMTKVDVEHGRAAVEVDQIFKENNVQIMDGGVTTQLIKTGYYEFDANRPEARVFSGRAEVLEGENHWEAVKGHHELALVADTHGKTHDFDPNGTGDQLFEWSKLRSEYLAEANNEIAGQYMGAPGVYPGWYWDPYAWNYTFIGMNPYWSPFGWGFYPRGGWGSYGHPFYGHGYYGHPVEGGAFRGGFGGGGFHGGGGMRGGR